MYIEFTKFNNTSKFVRGVVDYGRYRFEAKLFDEGSEYGINEGRVSGLNIEDYRGNWVVNYDRGWDIEPTTDEHKDVFDLVLDFLENSPKRFE